MSWADAVRIAGSRDRIAHGIHPKTVAGWKVVPAYRVIQIVLEDISEHERPLVPEELAIARRLLDELYASTRGTGDRWRLLMQLLEPPEAARAVQHG